MSPLLVQLSDPHIGASWGGVDPVSAFERAVGAVVDLDAPAPDAVLLTGDLANSGADVEYERLLELLAPISSPVYVLAGNHDDRDALRRHFGAPGTGPGTADAPVQYAVDLGDWRLLVLDTKRPGVDSGQLDSERLDWLETELTASTGRPVLLAMHHPPVLTGMPAFDRIGLPDGERAAVSEIVGRHANVHGVIAGHVHRAIVAPLAGRPVLVAPSTYRQSRLELLADTLEFGDETPGFAVHLLGRELVSHVVTVRTRLTG